MVGEHQVTTIGLPKTNLADRQIHLVRRILILGLAVVGLTWDLWSKHEVFRQLGIHGSYPVWKGQFLGIAIQFQLETTFNYGALWGMGQGLTWLFAAFSFLALGVIAFFIWNRQATSSIWLAIITGLLLAGTLGNLFDRLGLHGWKNDQGESVSAVRDFLDFWFFGSFHWATFNFADSYLVTGAIMLVLHSFWTSDSEEKSNQPKKETST